MANEIDLTLSEFLRLKGISKANKVTNYEKEQKEKDEEIKKLKVALSFYDVNAEYSAGIALHLTDKQKLILLDLFSNYYRDGKPVEYQIVHYLIEDIFTINHDLK